MDWSSIIYGLGQQQPSAQPQLGGMAGGPMQMLMRMFAPQMPGLPPQMQQQMAMQALLSMGSRMMMAGGQGARTGEGIGQATLGSMQDLNQTLNQSYRTALAARAQEDREKERQSLADWREYQKQRDEMEDKWREGTLEREKELVEWREKMRAKYDPWASMFGGGLGGGPVTNPADAIAAALEEEQGTTPETPRATAPTSGGGGLSMFMEDVKRTPVMDYLQRSGSALGGWLYDVTHGEKPAQALEGREAITRARNRALQAGARAPGAASWGNQFWTTPDGELTDIPPEKWPEEWWKRWSK